MIGLKTLVKSIVMDPFPVQYHSETLYMCYLYTLTALTAQEQKTLDKTNDIK